MIWLPPLLFIAVLGFVSSERLIRSVAIPYRSLFLAAISIPVGFSICSLTLFLAFLIYPESGYFIALISILALIGCLVFNLLVKQKETLAAHPSTFNLSSALREKTAQWQRLSLLEKTLGILAIFIFALSLFKACSVFHSVSLSNIFGGWDAKFFWNVKAKFFFRSPSEWQNMFAPELDWAHPDYPLLVPGAVAWGWFWTGKELQIWPALVAFSFYASFTLWITWYLCSSTKAVYGLLGGAFFMTLGAVKFWSISQYADVPLAFFITASTSLLVLFYRTKQLPLLLLAGWLAGSAAWSKNEGLLFFFWFIAAFAIPNLIKLYTSAEIRKQPILLMLGALLPITCLLILKYALAPHGDYLGSGRSLSDYANAIFGDVEKTKTIVKGFSIYMASHTSWNGLWLLFLGTLLIAGLAQVLFKLKTNFLIAATAILILAGYFVVLHTSPHNIVFQIQTAMERLLIHASGLVTLFIFETLAKLTAAKSTHSDQ